MMDELFQCLFLLLVGLLTALYFLYRFRNGPKTEGMKGRAAQVTSAKLSALYSVPVKVSAVFVFLFSFNSEFILFSLSE